MGDGLYHFVKVLGVTAKSLHEQSKLKRSNNRGSRNGSEPTKKKNNPYLLYT